VVPQGNEAHFSLPGERSILDGDDYHMIETVAIDQTTILRAAQFYGGFIAQVLKLLTAPPIGLIPKGFYYQPVDTDEVAEQTVKVVKAGPSDQVLDIAGPRTYELVDLARTWLQAQGKRKPLLQIPIPGKFAAAMRAGDATAPERARDGLTREDWLQRQYSTGS
jgi:uncharacterized protein YbjT (DUF2867 family)